MQKVIDISLRIFTGLLLFTFLYDSAYEIGDYITNKGWLIVIVIVLYVMSKEGTTK